MIQMRILRMKDIKKCIKIPLLWLSVLIRLMVLLSFSGSSAAIIATMDNVDTVFEIAKGFAEGKKSYQELEAKFNKLTDAQVNELTKRQASGLSNKLSERNASDEEEFLSLLIRGIIVANLVSLNNGNVIKKTDDKWRNMIVRTVREADTIRLHSYLYFQWDNGEWVQDEEIRIIFDAILAEGDSSDLLKILKSNNSIVVHQAVDWAFHHSESLLKGKVTPNLKVTVASVFSEAYRQLATAEEKALLRSQWFSVVPTYTSQNMNYIQKMIALINKRLLPPEALKDKLGFWWQDRYAAWTLLYAILNLAARDHVEAVFKSDQKYRQLNNASPLLLEALIQNQDKSPKEIKAAIADALFYHIHGNTAVIDALMGVS